MDRNQKMCLRIVLTTVLLIAAGICSASIPVPWYVETLVYVLIYAFIGFDIVLEAVSGIGRGQLFDENFLMVLATFGAFGTRQYPEAVAVMLLYQIGELFQRYAVGKSRGSISELMDLRPDAAHVFREGIWISVMPEDVEVGETIIVKPGERVPLDGIITAGESAVDTSALTGESAPRFCHVGNEILSGMIVSTGALEIKVERAFYDSTVSKILDLVENASGKKAKAEKFITKFSRFYTPVVVISAIIMALVPPLFDGQWSDWISRGMNFLVVSCPCALVISVPMTFFSGIGAASAQGVLVKGGNYLELLNKVDMFVFDKTGTLTKGKFAVSDVQPAEQRSEILRLAAIAEQLSLHPIALSIMDEVGACDNFGWRIEEKAGHGVIARKDGDVICVGNERLLSDNGIYVKSGFTAGTLIHVALNGKYIGYIEIMDALKSNAASALKELKAQGAKTIILTGDRIETARMVAKAVGADEVKAELLPADKVMHVERLLSEKKKGSVLAFVGDGINDAPVLMRADIGVAMGGIGSDAAIEAADIVLMHDDLDSIVRARKIAARTMRIVTQNIVFALGVKLAVLALTPFGLVSIWLAIFADVGVAVLAILNAMRAGKK